MSECRSWVCVAADEVDFWHKNLLVSTTGIAPDPVQIKENLMRVKVLCLGRSAKEIEVPENTIVEAAIQQAGFPKDSSYTRHVNGSPAFDSDILQDGSVLTLVPMVKGGR
ncbi:hypothetical protein HUU59_13100 [bacterium]|nr:hypothetical protein [bacterium]